MSVALSNFYQSRVWLKVFVNTVMVSFDIRYNSPRSSPWSSSVVPTVPLARMSGENGSRNMFRCLPPMSYDTSRLGQPKRSAIEASNQRC